MYLLLIFNMLGLIYNGIVLASPAVAPFHPPPSEIECYRTKIDPHKLSTYFSTGCWMTFHYQNI